MLWGPRQNAPCLSVTRKYRNVPEAHSAQCSPRIVVAAIFSEMAGDDLSGQKAELCSECPVMCSAAAALHGSQHMTRRYVSIALLLQPVDCCYEKAMQWGGPLCSWPHRPTGKNVRGVVVALHRW